MVDVEAEFISSSNNAAKYMMEDAVKHKLDEEAEHICK